jgi:hypothetical protein
MEAGNSSAWAQAHLVKLLLEIGDGPVGWWRWRRHFATAPVAEEGVRSAA